MSKNGSMAMKIIKNLVQHVNRYVPTLLPTDTKYFLTLDRHSSRNGFAFREYCKIVGFAVVQLPSDTSRLLQACDDK